MNMRKASCAAAAVAVFVLAGAMLARGGPGGLKLPPLAIYGSDDRIEVFAADARRQKLARGVVALFASGKVKVDPATGKVELTTGKYCDRFNLCGEESFAEQPSGAFCSGSLVGSDLVLTAGHCMDGKAHKCGEVAFVFGFGIAEKGADPARIAKGDVYGCVEIVKTVKNATDGDYALVRLDREVKGREPLGVNSSGDVKEGTSVFTIGHPKGLPAKVAGNAKVKGVKKPSFGANLDTYQGNSGSPVFNAETDLIEGVLVAGAADFAGCKRPGHKGHSQSCLYGDDTKWGETVTLASMFSGELRKATASGKKRDKGGEETGAGADQDGMPGVPSPDGKPVYQEP